MHKQMKVRPILHIPRDHCPSLLCKSCAQTRTSREDLDKKQQGVHDRFSYCLNKTAASFASQFCRCCFTKLTSLKSAVVSQVLFRESKSTLSS